MIFPSKNVESKEEDFACWKGDAVSATGKQTCILLQSFKGNIQKNAYELECAELWVYLRRNGIKHVIQKVW